MKWLLPLLLAGCAAAPVLERETVTLTVRELPTLDSDGAAILMGDRCTVYLRRYPKCLAHEVRHCLEGFWHEGPSGEDC